MAELAETVFVVKGVLAVIGVVLLVAHMDRCWPEMTNPAQRARYLCLLGFGVLLSGATAEQLADDVELGLRHWAALTMAAALVATAGYSIHCERKKR